LTALLRSLLYAAIFYPMTVLWVLAGIAASLFGRRPMLAVVLSWVEIHHWLAEHVLRIRIRVEGRVPPGPYLIAVKHQSILETTEMVRITHLPVIVIKKELADLPLFGWLTRRYGVIRVDRSAGAKALRALVARSSSIPKERAFASARRRN
jgi:1-acyl-sn-glycerol-3-phosphate acyltransferase